MQSSFKKVLFLFLITFASYALACHEGNFESTCKGHHKWAKSVGLFQYTEGMTISTSTTTQTTGIEISAPTPGNIVRLEVEVGDTIYKEQTLLVMEAMKMESEVKSPQVGVVQAVHVKAGNTVQTGDALLTLRG